MFHVAKEARFPEETGVLDLLPGLSMSHGKTAEFPAPILTIGIKSRPQSSGVGVSRELNVLALVKGEERYVFVYDDGNGDELIDTFRQWAADPQLSFSWFDAAVMTDKARQQALAATADSTPPDRLSRIAEV